MSFNLDILLDFWKKKKKSRDSMIQPRLIITVLSWFDFHIKYKILLPNQNKYNV